ncbi:hypothetical protein H4J45_09705 [Colwellia sp. BRX10-6]|uniref:hypothetical protein n=1 Tax=unclassified Colwellia TaxID=196834 RepID=UPI0015F4813E|nr:MULTISPECIES: hypothetical protein [unclassified Colwellia]MBA6383648.1 hypothetical protein [Colwellia sp. BRX10-9]MBA6394358.1 hypothetical protein [Colwellia sp. BRX10-6]
MNISDIVTNNDSKNIFAITSMEVLNGSQVLTLVEVKPEQIDEHLYPDADPIVISMQELQAFYKQVS